jgi:hypothetical protein
MNNERIGPSEGRFVPNKQIAVVSDYEEEAGVKGGW